MISLDCGLNPITLPALGKCLRIETIRALSHQRKSMSTGSLCLLIACRTTQDTLIVCTSHDRLIAWNIFTCKTMVKNTKLTSRCLCSFLKVYRTKASMLQFDQIIMMKSIVLIVCTSTCDWKCLYRNGQSEHQDLWLPSLQLTLLC